MSVSDENTNELDSYGVWVKHSSGEENLAEAANDTIEEPAIDDSLDLPDFDDSEFSDMFKDDNTDSALTDDFGSDLDSTLSADELANITSGDISFEETPPVENTENDSIDFEFEENIPESDPAEGFVEEKTDEATEDSAEDPFADGTFDIETPADDTPVEETAFEETPAEEPVAEEPVAEETSIEEPSFDVGEEEISIDEFDLGDNAETAEDTPAPAAEESQGDEEISLDDFMDGGFSDESVASGNNGFEEGKQPEASSGEEEVSLDDFVDMSSFDMGPADAPKEEEIVEEAPLDMDISFDDSADTVETEENLSVDSIEEDDEEYVEEENTETEEVSLDDFGPSFETSSEQKEDSAAIDTEEVDLSDFGIDAEAEETPIVQDVEESKNKEVVVDYDLSVGDENTSAAPVVSEIVSPNKDTSDISEIEEAMEEPVAESQAVVEPGSEVVSSSLLQQIVNDLSGLKDEINQLKTNLAEIKAGDYKSEPVPIVKDNFQVDETTFENDITVDEPAAEETIIENEEPAFEETSVETDIDIDTQIDTEIVPEDNAGGFFGLDDTDDTIALSGDELDNIFNSAEFSETPVEEPSDLSFNPPIEDEEVSTDEETPVEEEISIDEEPVSTDDLPNEIPVEENIDSDALEQDSIEIEETFVDEQVDESMDLPNEIPVSEEVSIEEPVSEEAAVEEPSFDVEESNEEMNAEDFDIETEEETIEETINDNLDESLTNDDEINFDFEDEKLEEPEFGDEIAVDEGNGEDLPDEISIPKSDDILVETDDSDFMDSVKDSTEIEEEAVETAEAAPVTDDIAFDTVDSFLGEEETAVASEEVADEMPVEETVEETSEEPAETSDYVEVDNLNNDLTESNIDYLTTKDDEDNVGIESDEEEKATVNSDLKKDIKSVLLYMDQLLENLPEDKIIEFAKSDEFATYKKLFSELGLS